jgi:hypothetical protein
VKLFAIFVLGASMAWSAGSARILYTKSFPGSSPPYIGISLKADGAGEYREAPDEDPMLFQLAEADVNEIFSLAEKLGRFTRPLESKAKVANMGMKTLRWEDGKGGHEVKFNFSEDLDARLITDWFERIAESEQHLINLERAAKYDKLGVNKALLLLESAMNRKRLVALNQYLPMLDRVAKNETYLNMARERAAKLAAIIRDASSATNLATSPVGGDK